MSNDQLQGERERFEAALAANPDARLWNTTDAMFWAWQAARAELASDAEPVGYVEWLELANAAPRKNVVVRNMASLPVGTKLYTAPPSIAQAVDAALKTVYEVANNLGEFAGAMQTQEHADVLTGYADQLFAIIPTEAAQVERDAKDAELLDAVERLRISLVPEFEGPWNVEVYQNGVEDSEEPVCIASGNDVRSAIRAAIASAKREG